MVNNKLIERFNDKQINNFINKFGALFALFLLMLLITILNPNFMTMNNLMNLLRQVSINGFIAFGMTFVIITSGIDLSVGSSLALSGAVVAGLMVSGINPIVAMLAGLLLGALLGIFNGVLISRGKLAPFIATLATMSIYRGITLVLTGGNPVTASGDNPLFEFIGRGYILGIPFPVILLFVTLIILYFVLHRTAFGKKAFAVGGNEKAAKIAGVKIGKIKLYVYTISGILSAISGIILASRLSSAQPTAGTTFEMDAIAAVVLGGTSMSGGRGSIVGTLIGALIIGTLNNGLNLLGVSSFYQQIMKGVVIILAVLVDRKRDN